MSTMMLPRDSVYHLQKVAGAMELLAALATEGVSDKKLSKLVDAARHPVKPWVAAVEPKGSGVVWNVETSEVVAEFSLEISQGGDDEGVADEDSAAGGEHGGALTSPTASKGFLQRGSSSPTAVSYIKSSRKSAGLHMLFYDQESIACTAQIPAPRTCFDEWLIILTATGIVVYDLNQNAIVRRITSDELNRQVPICAEILPYGLLAVGCQDGKVRVINPRLGKIMDTIDSGSAREVQHLVLIATPPLVVSRNASGSRSSSTTLPMDTMYTQRQFLVCSTSDGRVVAWRVNSAGQDGAEFIKLSDMEIRDAFKGFDTSAGVAELRFHASQDTLTVTTRDGGVYIFDATPLLTQNKPPGFVGVLPPSKLQGLIVLPGTRKGVLTAASISTSGTALSIMEITPKGRYVGKDNIPTSFLEFSAVNTFESRDLRSFVPAALQKKFKLLALNSSSQSKEEICCLTSYGLLMLRARLTNFSAPIFIVRGPSKAPLVAYPSTLKVGLRMYGEDTSPKQEDHKLQCNSESAQERLVPPFLQLCPSNPSFMSAIVPASSHVEIIQMDSELRNQKSINMHAIFSGNAIAVAWHPLKQRFATLVPQEQNSRRLTRAASSATLAPKRRGFMFGGSKGSSTDDSGQSMGIKQRNAAARATTLSIYDIASDGHVELVEDHCSTPDDQLLHIYSGPFLCVVRFIVDETYTAPSSASGADAKGESHDTGGRFKRTESVSIGTILSPTAAGGAGMSPFSPSNSASGLPADPIDMTCDLKKVYIEFYEWDSISKLSSEGAKHGLETSLCKIGGDCVGAQAAGCPLFLEWECVTHRFCALVYRDGIRVYHVTTTPREVTCVHFIPSMAPIQSICWFHQMLFYSTEDEVKCCLLSKARYFQLVLASRLVPLDGRWRAHTADKLNFPQPQLFPVGATTILGIRGDQLVLGGDMQSTHTIDLSNSVLQCCMLIAIGQAELAGQVAATLSMDVGDWIAAVFEAFGFVVEATKLLHASTSLKINICIKHNLFAELAKLLHSVNEDSPDTTGRSAFQRSCVCLHRAKQTQPLDELLPLLLRSKRCNDAVFVASLLQNDELLRQALSAKSDFGGSFHLAKHQSVGQGDLRTSLESWNASLTLPISAWKSDLESQGIRPPESLILSSHSR